MLLSLLLILFQLSELEIFIFRMLFIRDFSKSEKDCVCVDLEGKKGYHNIRASDLLQCCNQSTVHCTEWIYFHHFLWPLELKMNLKFDPNSILVVNFILTGNKHILIINSYINEYICYTLQVKKLIKNILKLLKKKKITENLRLL